MSESLEDLKQLLVEQEATLGPEHPKVANTMCTLADLLCVKKAFDQAEQTYWRVVEIRHKHGGQRSLEVAAALEDLGSFYILQQSWTDAERLLRWCCDIKRELLGALAPEYLSSMALLKGVLQKLGKTDETPKGVSSRQLMPFRAGVDKFPWNEHNSYVQQLFKADRLKDAEAYLALLRDAADCFGANTVHQARILQLQAKVFYRNNQLGQAKVACENSLAIFEREFGTKHVETMQCLVTLATVHIARDEQGEARFLLQWAHSIAIAIDGQQSERARRIEQKLVTLPCIQYEDEPIDGSFLLETSTTELSDERQDSGSSGAGTPGIGTARSSEVLPPSGSEVETSPAQSGRQAGAPGELSASAPHETADPGTGLGDFARAMREELPPHEDYSSPQVAANAQEKGKRPEPQVEEKVQLKFDDAPAFASTQGDLQQEDEIFAAFARLNTAGVTTPEAEAPPKPPPVEAAPVKTESISGVDPSEFMRDRADATAVPPVEAKASDRADDLFSQMMAMEQLEKNSRLRSPASEPAGPAPEPSPPAAPRAKASVPLAHRPKADESTASPAAPRPKPAEPPQRLVQASRVGLSKPGPVTPVDRPIPPVGKSQFGNAFGLRPGSNEPGADAKPTKAAANMDEFDDNLSTFLWEKYIKAGKLAMSQRNWVEAERMFTVALEKANGFHDDRLWKTLSLLGRSQQVQKKHESAESFFSRAQALCEMRLGPEHPDNIAYLKDLGGVYLELPDAALAQQCLERALGLMLKSGRTDHEQQEVKRMLEQCNAAP